MTALKWFGLALGVGALAAGALIVYGNLRWKRLTRELMLRLEAAREAPSPTRFDARELQGLPARVQRYFRAVLKDGTPISSRE